jgi:hypothetical protein
MTLMFFFLLAGSNLTICLPQPHRRHLTGVFCTVCCIRKSGPDQHRMPLYRTDDVTTAPLTAFCQTIGCLAYNALHVAACFELDGLAGSEGVLLAAMDGPFDYQQENFSMQYMKWVGGVQMASNYGPENANRPVYLYEMVPENWPGSVTLHFLALALGHDPVGVKCMDVTPLVKTRVSLAKQMEHFGSLYPEHFRLFESRQWQLFCIALRELWDMVWVPTPWELPTNFTGSIPQTSKLGALRDQMFPKRQAMLARVSPVYATVATFHDYLC